MKKIALITFNLLLVAFLVALVEWLEIEEAKIDSITSEYKQTTQKLEAIAQTSKWLDTTIVHNNQERQNAALSDENLIAFFDAYKEEYALLLQKYIYVQENVKKMDFSYKVALDRSGSIKDLMDISYEGGYVQFQEMLLQKEALVGKLSIVQPQAKGENNASKH